MVRKYCSHLNIEVFTIMKCVHLEHILKIITCFIYLEQHVIIELAQILLLFSNNFICFNSKIHGKSTGQNMYEFINASYLKIHL